MTLIYLFGFIQRCLEVIKALNKDIENQAKATKAVQDIVIQNVPSEKSHYLKGKGLFKYSAAEDKTMKEYMSQLKQETAARLLNKLYHPEHGTLFLKHWCGLSKRKFMDMKFA